MVFGMLKPGDIPGHHHLYRRVADRSFDATRNKCLETAFLLRPKEEFLSVDWAEKTTQGQACISNGKKYKLAELLVQTPRDRGLEVRHVKPYTTAHSGIYGADLSDPVKLLDLANYLADNSTMVVC